jgi:gas vesicle protein
MSDTRDLQNEQGREASHDGGHDGGSFVTGVTLGLLAGVTGVFLFGTKRGKKTLEHWQKEWEKVKPQVEEGLVEAEGTLKKSKRPFFQAVGEIVDYVAEHLEQDRAKSKGKSQKSLPSPAAKTTKRTFFKK